MGLKITMVRSENDSSKQGSVEERTLKVRSSTWSNSSAMIDGMGGRERWTRSFRWSRDCKSWAWRKR
jgi:hypothetical protein